MPTPAAELRASLERHNKTFESLLKLIPARYYLVQEESEEQASTGCEYTGEDCLTRFLLLRGADRLQIPEA